MTSLINKLTDWPPNYHKILIFYPPKSLKKLCTARIDELADSNKSVNIYLDRSKTYHLPEIFGSSHESLLPPMTEAPEIRHNIWLSLKCY